MSKSVALPRNESVALVILPFRNYTEVQLGFKFWAELFMSHVGMQLLTNRGINMDCHEAEVREYPAVLDIRF